MPLVVRPLLLVMFAATLALAPEGARAEWRRTSDIELNTAFTLEEGSLSVGILSPLTVGVTESFQASIHPLLLLLGQPSLAFRLRVTPADDVTVSMNLAGAWSFIERETREGLPASEAEGAQIGFPGMLQLTSTASLRLGRRWVVSAGAGLASDFLGEDPVRLLAELHLSAHWLPASRHLVMAQVMGNLPLTEEAELTRPSAQILYAWAVGARVQIAAGVGFGEWVWETSSGARSTVRVLPMLDVWFRF